MANKKTLYQYNPETDDFERLFPTWGSRLRSAGGYLLFGLLFGALMILVIFLWADTPTEKNLRKENGQLRRSLAMLERRIDNSNKVLKDIQNRDDNFYRVMMQMDPLDDSQRLAGMKTDNLFRTVSELSDASLTHRVEVELEMLERKLLSQSLSFDQLKEEMERQKERVRNIPSIMPIRFGNYTVAAGFGQRIEPISGATRFHEGIDLIASPGTPVYATAAGTVTRASRRGGYGNCIDIDHDHDYTTRYAHLSMINVREGQKVKTGDVIGRVGSSGRSLSPHLHYEVRFRHEPQDPVNFYFQDLTPAQYDEMARIADNAANLLD